MLQLPEQVQIGPYLCTVDQSSEIGRSLHAEDLSGKSDLTAQTIAVDPEQGPDSLRDTLLHEVMHLVWGVWGLGSGPAKEHEELVVTAFATGLLDTLRRNPALVQALLSERDR